MFCILFGGVYENFGHGVLSFHMVYAFTYPMAFGMLPFLIISKKESLPYPTVAAGFLHTSIATATVGSLVQGVLDIYGTTNRLSIYYVYASAALLLISIITYIVQLKNN